MPCGCRTEVEINRKSRLSLRLQATLFTLLFTGIVGMLAWLSTQYVYQSDWTAGARNTVSAETQRLLEGLDGPVGITAYVGPDELLRQQIRELIGSYQRFSNNITLEFINPDTVPEQVRELGITRGGAIIISYHGASEQVTTLSEQHITNALLRLTRQEERWIVFVTGHGERPPEGELNYSMGIFASELNRKGLRTQTINLAEHPVPDNTSVLVLASPRVALLPGELAALQDYIERGGNLLWLTEPEAADGLQALAELLGIERLPGVVVDATSSMFGVENPSFVVVTGYPNHAVTREMSMVTVFPEAVALAINDSTDWDAVPLLSTLERSWTELGELEGEIRFDAGTDERAGPLLIGVALTHAGMDDDSGRQQRVIVTGDGDFLSNTYLGNAGNLSLGLNMLHWLAHDDAFIDIQVRGAPDTILVLDNTVIGIIGIGFLIGLPLLLLLAGLAIWLLRRRR